MNWLKRLLEYFGWSLTRTDEMVVAPEQEKYHCIRFMTDKGEQIGILLTSDEFETGIRRWVDTIEEMPIEMANPTEDERIP
jgi:hypothetical protein